MRNILKQIALKFDCVKNTFFYYTSMNIMNTDIEVNTTISELDLQLDKINKEMFDFIKGNIMINIANKLKKEPEGVKAMCCSNNNSRPIADYMEQLTSDIVSKALFGPWLKGEVYMSGNEGRTDHDRLILKGPDKYCVIHLDNKGVIVQKRIKQYTIDQLKTILSELGHGDRISGLKKNWVPYIEYITNNGLLNNGINGEVKGGKIIYMTDEYCEKCIDPDHPNENFHMKSSQSNLNGFTGKIDGKEVCYSGLIPSTTDIPHFTFIVKHIYSVDLGVHKLVLISVPHCTIQSKHFPDINMSCNKKRMAKAKDEFRFNMHDSDGKPYTFLGTDEPRYTVFNVIQDVTYG